MEELESLSGVQGDRRIKSMVKGKVYKTVVRSAMVLLVDDGQ